MFTKSKLIVIILSIVGTIGTMTIPVTVFASGNTGSTQVEVFADDSNLTVTVPTEIPFVMHADGTLTSSELGEVINGSNFAIHVKSVSVTPNKPFTIVTDASGEVEGDNVVSFKFGKSGHEIDACTQVVEDGQYNLSPVSVSDGSHKFTLSASGFASRVNVLVGESGHWEDNLVWVGYHECRKCGFQTEDIYEIGDHCADVCDSTYTTKKKQVNKPIWVTDGGVSQKIADITWTFAVGTK